MKSRIHMKMAGVAEPTDTFAPCTVLTFTSTKVPVTLLYTMIFKKITIMMRNSIVEKSAGQTLVRGGFFHSGKNPDLFFFLGRTLAVLENMSIFSNSC
jgi:hypothetical protein